jgi:hypothetical protein
MKEKEIRKPRSYKIADKPYLKAKKRAKGELATMIESIVTSYAEGFNIHVSNATKPITSNTTKK